MHILYTPEADILVAHSILTKYVSEKSANEIVTAMQAANLLPLPTKEGD